MNVYVMFSILTVVVLVLNCSFFSKYKNTYKQQANICKRIRDGGIDKEDITKGCAKVLSHLEENSIAKLITDFHKAAKKHNLKYCICAGNLLGYHREGGQIKWDDDVDVTINKVYNTLNKHHKIDNVNFNRNDRKHMGFSFDKVFHKHGSKYAFTHCETDVNYTWPFIDVFFEDKEEYCHPIENNEKIKEVEYRIGKHRVMVNICENSNGKRKSKCLNKRDGLDTGYRHQNENGVLKHVAKCKVENIKDGYK